MGDSAEDVARDVAAVGRIDAVPTLLKVLCDMTGMGFAAVARVTDGTWTACAVEDQIAFGLKPGGQLDVTTTLCRESRAARAPVVIDHASQDPQYCDHPTPRLYRIESYVSVPIILEDDSYFGNLCAIDPKPAQVKDPRVLAMFTHFAELIARHLDSEQSRDDAQAALLDARAAGELRDQFIAVLGHDLRTPLAAVAQYGYLLQHQAEDPAAVRNISTRIKANVARMSALIDDTLDLARGRLGGGIGVRLEPIVDVDDALAAVVTELQDAQPERVIESEIGDCGKLVGDRGRLQQLASNLLGNALVHGSLESPVKFSAGCHDNVVVIEVWNDGVPIPPESLELIFKPFWRAAASADRQGLGLGLHICKQIVEAHGGTLTVTSSARDGTRFVARLPLAR